LKYVTVYVVGVSVSVCEGEGVLVRCQIPMIEM
jgi:hypothetical protein